MTNPQQNTNSHDLYGFFHGRDYRAAINDFVAVSGRTMMVPRWASGVWWSRWYDLSNADVLATVRTHDDLAIPLDVFVLDMNWHQKNDWTGFTFDSHLFPYPSDTMAALHAIGLGVTVNVHDNSGINSFEKQFQPLAQVLGLPPNQTNAAFNLLNETWAYAVEDRVLGDILQQSSISCGLTGSRAAAKAAYQATSRIPQCGSTTSAARTGTGKATTRARSCLLDGAASAATSTR